MTIVSIHAPVNFPFLCQENFFREKTTSARCQNCIGKARLLFHAGLTIAGFFINQVGKRNKTAFPETRIVQRFISPRFGKRENKVGKRVKIRICSGPPYLTVKSTQFFCLSKLFLAPVSLIPDPSQCPKKGGGISASLPSPSFPS